MKKSIFGTIILFLLISVGFYACTKDDVPGEGKSAFHVRLTDAPNSMDSVLVDIQQIRIKLSDDSLSNDGWMDMNTEAGVYDLLSLQNGVDTLLATDTLATFTTVKQIRFILGPENRVVVSGVSHPLTIPSGAESGLKINVNKALNDTLETLVIDFDAALSIHQTGNGEYKLRPVLKVQ